MSSASNAFSTLVAEQNLKKYQDESTKVSSVSVSLVYFFPSIVTDFQSFWTSRGLPLVFKSISSGNLIGSWSSGILVTSFFSL